MFPPATTEKHESPVSAVLLPADILGAIRQLKFSSILIHISQVTLNKSYNCFVP